MSSEIKYNEAEKEFYNKAFVWSNTLLFEPTVAIELIRRCRELHIGILGIDAFRKIDNKIQSMLEHSIDYTYGDNKYINDDRWNDAEKFINKRLNLGLIFEIVCD